VSSLIERRVTKLRNLSESVTEMRKGFSSQDRHLVGMGLEDLIQRGEVAVELVRGKFKFVVVQKDRVRLEGVHCNFDLAVEGLEVTLTKIFTPKQLKDVIRRGLGFDILSDL